MEVEIGGDHGRETVGLDPPHIPDQVLGQDQVGEVLRHLDPALHQHLKILNVPEKLTKVYLNRLRIVKGIRTKRRVMHL